MRYAYNGDYEDLIDWIIDAYDPQQYETFTDWLADVIADFKKSRHHFSNSIKEDMKGVWEVNFPDRPIKKKKIDTEEFPQKRFETYNRIIDLGTFTTKDAFAENPNRPQSSIRRELQELVKEGKLERLEKGVYKLT